ncbi:adenosine deaminase-like [Convolutriloba macropyga]|uniref:adenosine deaminase-like n=1 Tax=Convolutriloba macropyga TaxID=536237 RepID=UPI003F523D5F
MTADFLPGFYNVELHHHLAGCIRAETIKDLAIENNINFDYEAFDMALSRCDNLVTFLQCFAMFRPVIQSNPQAIERVAYECVEDEYRNRIAYFETRFSPYLLLSEDIRSSALNLDAHFQEIVDAAIRGLQRGEKDFGVKSSIIFCHARGQVSSLKPLTQLLETYKANPKIVGVDVGGNENLPWTDEEFELTKLFYKTAKELGYKCTFHAGEQGLAESIERGLNSFHVDRIGHGYAVFKDAKILELCLQKNVHFEFCPVSAKVLNSLGTSFDSPENPILLGMRGEMNLSLNCDDSLFFGHLQESISLCRQHLSLSDEDLLRVRVNAAKATFLNRIEKSKLIQHINNGII